MGNRKQLLLILMMLLLFVLSSCTSKEAVKIPEIDIDLAIVDQYEAYTKVYDIMTSPNDYVGKTVKIHGTFSSTSINGINYYNIMIADGINTPQSIEFLLADNAKYPEEYPTVGYEATIVGNFEVYQEDGYYFCRLINAVWIK